MESDSNGGINNNSQDIFMKIEIKEEPVCPNETLIQVKSECEDGTEFCSKTVLASSCFVKESTNNRGICCNEMYNKIEIKQEPCWTENVANEIKHERKLPFLKECDWQNEIKEADSPINEVAEYVAAKDASRLNAESIGRNSNSISHCFTVSNLGENIDPVYSEQYKIFSSSQTQMLENSIKNYNLDADAECKRDSYEKNFIILSDINEHNGNAVKQQFECDKSFIDSSTVKDHTLLHEREGPYVCEICRKSFTQTSTLKRHKLVTHQGIKLHKCNKGFIQASTLKEHKLIHEGKRSHVCEICNKSFTQSSTLKQHKLIHEGIRPHRCETCKKSFTHLSTLKKHKVIHEGRKAHKCEICNKNFTLASNVKKHKLIHEGKSIYSCEICKKSFTEASTLKQHKLIIHEGKRLHICEICNKSFTRAPTLKEHKLIHEDKKPHSCEICNKSFIRISRLKRHILTHEVKR